MDFNLYFCIRVREQVGAIKTVCPVTAYIVYRMDGYNGVSGDDCEKKRLINSQRQEMMQVVTLRSELQEIKNKQICNPVCRKSSEFRHSLFESKGLKMTCGLHPLVIGRKSLQWEEIECDSELFLTLCLWIGIFPSMNNSV